MQQTMDEITDYLESIDARLDDVLRAHSEAVLADMVGVDLVIEEAMIVRERVGRVSEVTWSKVQATASTIARTQAYALRRWTRSPTTWSATPPSATWRRPRLRPRSASRSGWRSWPAASRRRTPSRCWRSTACSTVRRRRWTGTARGCRPPATTGST
nr:hypothetical protein [Angustibacter aerolatus]